MEKRLRIIDLNELEAMAKMKEDALKSYLINCLIPALEFPDCTRDIISDVFEEGYQNGYFQPIRVKKKDYISNLIKE